MHNFHYVYHKETDEQAFRLQEGEFDGIVWKYTDIRLPLHDKNGNRLDLEEAKKIPLTFRYEVLYNKDDLVNEESADRFVNTIGDILMIMIKEGLEHDQIKVGTEDRNNDSEQSDP